MKNKLYLILPVVAFFIIITNAFFGHLIFDLSAKQDINKYSTYIHLQPEWKSYPRNILFDVTTVWQNPYSNTNDPYYESGIDVQLKTEYNTNELQFLDGKSYVELRHEFSDCKNKWQPIFYKYIIDTLSHKFDYLIGLQLNSDPYTVLYPEISNSGYSISEQQSKLKSGYSQFIPICSSKNVTSYDYSIKINGDSLGFDVYFVPSVKERDNYHQNFASFNYYQDDGCFAQNYKRFSGTCKNISKESGLLIIIPDELKASLTEITVNLYEKI